MPWTKISYCRSKHGSRPNADMLTRYTISSRGSVVQNVYLDFCNCVNVILLNFATLKEEPKK